MTGLPTVSAVGTLTAEPELRFTPAGAAVVNFTVAANDRKYNRDSGAWEDAGTTFLRCSAWRQLAENVAESFGKGDRVMVHGTLKQREYERDGVRRTAMELDVEEVGASVKWATAKVSRVSRSSGGEGRSDAFATAATGSADEAPF